MEAERLQLIWDIYSWTGSQASGKVTKPWSLAAINKNRMNPVSWDLCQIFAAIAGGYVVELSPHYKGVQLVRKNKDLWKRVSIYVKLKTGHGCLPYDTGPAGEHWEHVNGVSFFEVE
jgi:hypothetical protein